MKTVKIGDIGEIISGSTPQTSVKEYWEGGTIPWVTPADLTQHTGVFFEGSCRRITEAGFKNCSSRMLPPGSILFTSRAPIGYCAVTKFPLCTNQGFKSIIPNEKLDSVYGFYALSYKTSEIVAKGRGATFSEVTKEIMSEVEIPLPPLEEQRRIAGILDQADRLRRLRRHARQLTDSFLQSVFIEMFGDPATNPKGWPVVQIEDIVTLAQYGTSDKSNQEGKGYPVLGMGNITYQGQLDLTNLSYVDLPLKEFEKLKLETGDIIFNRTNSTELVGKCTYWNNPMDAVLASYLVKLKLTNDVSSVFFTTLLNTSYFKRLFQERCKKAVGQSNISPTLLKEFNIMLPPITVQRDFEQVVNQANLIQRQQQETERQAELNFQALLHRAFTGQLTRNSAAV